MEAIEKKNELNIRFKEHPNLETAQAEAFREAADTFANVIPVTIFRQGTRYHFSGAMPIGLAVKLLQEDSVKKKAGMQEVRKATNRPVDSTHVREAARYLSENFKEKYILPPLTLNIRQRVNLYTTDYNSKIRLGYLVIPDSTKLSITDGQHRKQALIKTLESLNEEESRQFKEDGIALMMTCEEDLDQVHQDFADCSKTKPLPKSLIAVYDSRNPANGLVLKLIARCPLMNDGKIDSTSTSLSKRSNCVFITNQVRTMLKELLLGNGALSDKEFDRKAKEMLSEKTHFEKQLDNFVEFINIVTENHEILHEVATLPMGPERQKIPMYREKYLILNGNAWALIGRIGHELFRESISNWKEYAARIAKEINWERSADLWKGNIIQGDEETGFTIVRSNRAWKAAVAKIRDVLGLKEEENEDV